MNSFEFIHSHDKFDSILWCYELMTELLQGLQSIINLHFHNVVFKIDKGVEDSINTPKNRYIGGSF